MNKRISQLYTYKIEKHIFLRNIFILKNQIVIDKKGYLIKLFFLIFYINQQRLKKNRNFHFLIF